MAVAAADFYSYAKATGTPLPKSKQEEAQLAPAVNRWKKSRLKAPERERDSGDLGNVLGGGAIAAGLAGAALYGYRRGWGDSPASRKPAPTGDLPSEIPTRVYTDEQRPVDLKGTRNKKTGTYQASVYGIQKEQPQAGTQVRDIAGEEALWNANYWANFHAIKRANPSWNIADIDKQAVLAAKQATNQPIRKGYVPGPATDNRISLQEIPESSPVDFSPRNYVESTGAVEPTNVELPQITGTEPKGLLSQDFVQRALDETKPSYAQEFTKDELDALRGIRFAVKDIQNEGKPKFYENRGIDLDRISNAPKIKTGTFLDNAIGNLPATVIAADEVARRGVKDIGDAARGIKKVVVENAPSNLPDLSRVPKAGINTSPTVQLSDGSTVGPLYPFKQFVRGLTGDESVDIVEPDTLVGQQKIIASELADQSLESANSGYQQMDDKLDRSVQRDTDSIAVGSQAVELEKTKQALLSQAKLSLQNKRKASLSALDQDTKQALDLYAQTGDPETLRLLLEEPSLPTKVQTSGGEYDTKQFFDKTTKGEWVEDLESKDINLTNEVSRLSKEKQDIAAYNEIRLPQIEEDQNIARYAMDNAKTEGDENLFLKEYAKLEYEKNNLANPDDLNVDIGDALDQRDQVRREIAANKALGAKYKLNVEKQSRPYYELDAEGKIIPETVELRSEKFVKDTEPKGGGGRKVTAYNPDSQDLSTIGPYGIERANYPQSITSIAPSASPRSWTPAAGTARNENVNIVISGSRDYTNYPEFVQKTDQIIKEMNIPAGKRITIIEGGATGADKLAERYARERGYGLVVKPADWSKGGTLKYPQSDKSAGPRRNREMAKMGDVGIAFPGGKGTSNFVKTMAREEGKPVYYANQIQQATPESKRAIEISENIRKIYNSGRPDAQQQVQAYIQGLRKGQQF